MNGKKATVADVYEKLGGIEANTHIIIKRLDDGDKNFKDVQAKITANEKKISNNEWKIKYIYIGIGIIITSMVGGVIKILNKFKGG